MKNHRKHHKDETKTASSHHKKHQNDPHSEKPKKGSSKDIDTSSGGTEICPLCKSECPITALGCGKGEDYFSKLNMIPEDANDNMAEEVESYTDADDLESLFKHTSRLMSRHGHRHDHPHHAQRHVYRMIKEKGPLQQKELMEILGIRSASLSEIIAKLDRRGLITRERNEEDKRGFIVSVKEEMPISEEESVPGQQDLFSCLDDKETEQLTTLLQKVISSTDKELRGGHGRSKRHGKHGRPEGRQEKCSKGHSGKHHSGHKGNKPAK